MIWISLAHPQYRCFPVFFKWRKIRGHRAQLAGTRGTQIRCGKFPGHRPEVSQQVGPAECSSRHLWILSTYFMNIYHFFWHLENMKKYENMWKYHKISIFSIFKWCKLYVLRFQLFLSEVFECLLLCRRHERLQGLRGKRPSMLEKPTQKMSDTPENLQFNYVFVLFLVHIMCAYIIIYIYISVCPHICQILYVKYYIIYIYMSKFISYLL